MIHAGKYIAEQVELSHSHVLFDLVLLVSKGVIRFGVQVVRAIAAMCFDISFILSWQVRLISASYVLVHQYRSANQSKMHRDVKPHLRSHA